MAISLFPVLWTQALLGFLRGCLGFARLPSSRYRSARRVDGRLARNASMRWMGVKRGVTRRVVMVLRDACRWTRENCGRDQYGRD